MGLGSKIHRALELRDFASDNQNKEYSEYLERIKTLDGEETAKKVDEAVSSFLNSGFFKKYCLNKPRIEKEMELIAEIGKKENKIFMKDQIDLIIVDDKNNALVVADYKTQHPTENNIRQEFAMKHWEYQLGAYVLSLEKGLGLRVYDAVLLIYDKGDWIEHSLKIDIDKIEKEIETAINNIPVEEGGLKKNAKIDFCKVCEFCSLCAQEG
jgi:ATP-dependent exoDNAse (exonuclease V) beta subunit